MIINKRNLFDLDVFLRSHKNKIENILNNCDLTYYVSEIFFRNKSIKGVFNKNSFVILTNERNDERYFDLTIYYLNKISDKREFNDEFFILLEIIAKHNIVQIVNNIDKFLLSKIMLNNFKVYKTNYYFISSNFGIDCVLRDNNGKFYRNHDIKNGLYIIYDGGQNE